MTGCATTPHTPAPTGDALVASAEENYLRYRGFVNDLQSTLSTGPWEIGQIGSYGMQPGSCASDTGYEFTLRRTLLADPADTATNADTVTAFLRDAGMSPKSRTLGEENDPGKLVQVGVRDEGDFSQLLIQFYGDGRIRVSATTVCWPGDAKELREAIFGDVYLTEGYLPTDVEAPTDPLFFGITPGDPQFVRESPAS